MKKLFFTDVALVAFSGVSMGKSKENKVNVGKMSKFVAVVSPNPCATLASLMMSFYEDPDNCMTSEQYTTQWTNIYNKCSQSK